MDAVQGVNLALALLGSATNLLAQATAISGIVAKAQAEGRSTLTDEEWKSVLANDAAARQALIDSIAKA